MIVHCEKCRTKFDLDESKLKEGGSKVRCSVCKHLFTVYPQKQAFLEELEPEALIQDEFEKTVSLDLKRMLEEDPETSFDSLEDISLDEEAVSYRPDENKKNEPAKSLLDDLMTGPALDDIEEIEEIEEVEPIEWGREVSGRKGFDSMAPQRKTKSALPMILVVLVLLIVGAAVGTYFFMPDVIPDSLKIFGTSGNSKGGDPGIKALAFEDVEGTFVQSPKAGRLFVIKGIIKNNYPTGRRFIQIKTAILDDKEKEIKVANVFAGKSLNENTIRKLDKAAIKRVMRAKNRVVVKPGAKIPFTVILDSLPKNMSEFTVEAIKSSATK
jgi:predicted Zn finger-like uncharacterized protein